uniref:Uncharacterized protein n=1 Tax=Anguilla anguilla TaxID=7936 RepID=A0A0E9W4V9_ANGAN
MKHAVLNRNFMKGCIVLQMCHINQDQSMFFEVKDGCKLKKKKRKSLIILKPKPVKIVFG